MNAILQFYIINYVELPNSRMQLSPCTSQATYGLNKEERTYPLRTRSTPLDAAPEGGP